MSEQVSVCPVCGCAATGAATCPLCGTAIEVAQSSPEAQASQSSATSSQPGSAAILRSDSATSHASHKRKPSRRMLFIGAAVVGLIVMVFGGTAAFLAWTNDQDLKQRASDASSSSRGVVEVHSTRDSRLGNASGSLAGGGVVVSDDTTKYWANAKGIQRQEVSSKAESSLHLVTSDRAACLNLYDDALYYLASTVSLIGDEYEGQMVCVVDNPLQDSDGKGTSTVLYRVSGKDRIGCLSVRDGVMYFVVKHGDERILMNMPCDGSQEAREFARYKVEDAWLFIEGDMLYVVSTTATAWNVEVRQLGGKNADFRKWGGGDGRLKTACLSGGMLYYSLAQGQGASHLYRQDTMGGFSEYPEAAGVLTIAVDGDVVACVGQSGALMWVHATTGFAYDLGTVMEDSLGNPVPSVIGLGVLGDSICCVDNKGGSFTYNVNSGESAVLS